MKLSDSARERFWPKVDYSNPDGCWPWIASVISGSGGGYGQFRMGGSGSKMAKAHLIAYTELVGPVPDGMTLDHLCRNRRCCNPDHLAPVTPRINVIRGVSFAATNSQKVQCPRGHFLGGQNVYVHNGRRHCRECRRIADYERQQTEQYRDYHRRWSRTRRAERKAIA